MDTALIKYHMAKYGDSLQTLADALGIHKTTLSGKINGRDEFKQGEINIIVARYGLSPADTMKVFFNDLEVAKKATEGGAV